MRWLLASPPRVLLVLVLTAAVSAVVFGVSELAARHVNGIRAEATLLRQIATHIATIREATLHAESAQRGYLLTLDSRYLAPFNVKAAQAAKAFVELAVLTRNDEALGKRSQGLIELSTQRFDEMRLTISNAEQGRVEKALNIVRAGLGVQMMEELTNRSDAFESDTANRLHERTADVERALMLQRYGVGVVVLVNLVFLAILGRQTVRHFAQHEAHRKELQAQSDLLEQQVTARTEELSSLSSHLQESSERDKSRLARDLHDELGGILTSAKLDVAWLQGHSKNADPEIVPRLARLSQVLDEAVDLKRRVIESLRPSLLDHLGLSAALNWYVGEACTKAGLQVELKTPVDDQRVPPEIAIAMYRIVQEGVTNTIKYAEASSVRITVRREANVWKLLMDDNGVGIANFQADSLSHGIAGMRQRTRALGGRFQLRTSPGAGVAIEATFPVGATAPA
jgi:signal transduction histidine kinase